MSAEWIFDSAYPSVNFLNTLRDRYLGGRETLAEPADLGTWLVKAGVTDTAPAVAAAQLEQAHELRETIDAVLMAVGAGVPPRPKATRALNAAAAMAPRAVRQLRVARDGLPTVRRLVKGDAVAAALAELAADAIDLVAGRARVRECGADDCGLRFVDLSPAGNKQWCSMARCGNRVKSRKHHQRTVVARTSSGGATPAGKRQA